ncbi:unnamed protein product [Dovyalis caffra]|uniref:Uncharacterized protein n=1 Tax=Dovyalis caffra TaxID=77055 RepID=A0AAV1SFL8_9ROSI|nr:unnamed protein product [Dovyalis caffra]
MMRVMRSCIQSILKLVNCVVGVVGIAMVLYAVWLIRVWQREMGDFPFFDEDEDFHPWFVALSLIQCFSHIASEAANEAGVTADVFLNRDWEEAGSMTKNSFFDSHLMQRNESEV